MKRSIIFLMALIILCAMSVFASTPEQDMVLIVDEGDGDFSGLEVVSDEQMAQVEGNHVIYEPTEPDDKIIYIIDLGGSEGWIFVYNDGHAEITGIIPVNLDGTYEEYANVYIHNFHPTNLNDYLRPKKRN